VSNIPTASLEIPNIKVKNGSGNYEVTADIIINGPTKSITFDATVGADNATANVVINRTEFNIKYAIQVHSLIA
jgi:polyisoprenoid-binding protein YceI|tara:strand:+ start:1501 stop:1722 length:222 start_codon:yes stop_codon:yes gene_type:complete